MSCIPEERRLRYVYLCDRICATAIKAYLLKMGKDWCCDAEDC